MTAKLKELELPGECYPGDAADPLGVVDKVLGAGSGSINAVMVLNFIIQEARRKDLASLLSEYRDTGIKALAISEILRADPKLLPPYLLISPHVSVSWLHAVSLQELFAWEHWREAIEQTGWKIVFKRFHHPLYEGTNCEVTMVLEPK